MSNNNVAPSVGRIVLFGCRELAAADGAKIVEERPAIVSRVWSPSDPNGCVQLQVFTDGVNDREFFPALDPRRDDVPNVVRVTSVVPADDQLVAQINRWRWPPRT